MLWLGEHTSPAAAIQDVFQLRRIFSLVRRYFLITLYEMQSMYSIKDYKKNISHAFYYYIGNNFYTTHNVHSSFILHHLFNCLKTVNPLCKQFNIYSFTVYISNDNPNITSMHKKYEENKNPLYYYHLNIKTL